MSQEFPEPRPAGRGTAARRRRQPPGASKGRVLELTRSTLRQAVALLLDGGASLRLQASQGETAKDAAFEEGYLDLAE